MSRRSAREPSEATLETAAQPVPLDGRRLLADRVPPLRPAGREQPRRAAVLLARPQGHRAAAGAADPRRARRDRHRARRAFRARASRCRGSARWSSCCSAPAPRRWRRSRPTSAAATRGRSQTRWSRSAMSSPRAWYARRGHRAADQRAEAGVCRLPHRKRSRSRSWSSAMAHRPRGDPRPAAPAVPRPRRARTPKPKSAPFWRSGMTVPAIVAGFEGIVDLFEKSRIVEAVPEESRWIGDSVGFEIRQRSSARRPRSPRRSRRRWPIRSRSRRSTTS